MNAIGPQLVNAAIANAEEISAPVESPSDAVARLAALPPFDYDRVREDEAKRLGVRLTTLDAEVLAAARGGEQENNTNQIGAEVIFADPSPWPEPVDGSMLLVELAESARKHLVLPDHAAETIALWVLHAHLHETATISPILAITSPSPECGKTTLLELLGAIVPRPLPASNITTAALFRAVEKWSPTLLVDEADTFIRDSDELRGVLNSGHRRSAAYVIRTVGDDHDPRRFRTWAPKAIALIGKLPPTLDSRSIEIPLQRKTAFEKTQELRPDRLDQLEPVRSRCARFARDNAEWIAAADPMLPASLYGRAADNWRHLIAIADAAGGPWPGCARAAASASASSRMEQTAGIMLLEDVRTIFAERRVDRLSSADIVQALNKLEERPWSEWRSGNPLTANRMARLLAPFKLGPTKFRSPGYAPGTRGYELAAFADAFSRYLPSTADSQTATPPQANESAISREIKPPQTNRSVAVAMSPKLRESAGCGVVAVADREKGANAPTDEDRSAFFDERAAIMEFDGGLPRDQAEARAGAEIAVVDRGRLD